MFLLSHSLPKIKENCLILRNYLNLSDSVSIYLTSKYLFPLVFCSFPFIFVSLWSNAGIVLPALDPFTRPGSILTPPGNFLTISSSIMGCFNSKHSSPPPRPIRRRSDTAANRGHPQNTHKPYVLPTPPSHRRVVNSSPKKHHNNDDDAPRSKTTGVSHRSGLPHGNVEVEQVAAGWPSWLTSASPEAVHGLVPLRAEDFEKREKVI